MCLRQECDESKFIILTVCITLTYLEKLGGGVKLIFKKNAIMFKSLFDQHPTATHSKKS